MKTNNIGLYVHVPFCARKCKYCDFLSFECADESILMEYAEALAIETRINYEKWPYKILDSVFIGGGTQSLMPAEGIKKIIDTIRDCFFVSEDCEITIEANPATLTEKKVETYLECGINRISIGIQSFDNSILNMLGRLHDKNDAINAVRMVKKLGFKNMNIDLMFGIPGQTLKMWRDTVRQCVFLRPEHISLYSLQIEEGTPFYKMIYEDKIIEELPEKTDRQMYHEALSTMRQAGYDRYEISNVSLPGFESRHNLKYWNYEEYLGLGPGASSFMDGMRFKNCSNVPEYLRHIKEGKAPVDAEGIESYTRRDEMGIYIFTALRKADGFNVSDFENTFDVNFFDVYSPEILTKLRGLLVSDGQNLRLTDAGFDVSNRVMAEFV